MMASRPWGSSPIYLALRIILDDFGACVLAFQDHPGLPDERLVGDQVIHGHNETGDHPLRHEVILVPEHEVVRGLPGIGGAFRGQQLRSDVDVAFRKLVAQLELHHQSQQLIAHRPVALLGPDCREIAAGEPPAGIHDLLVVEQSVHRVGAPLRFEDHSLFENGIILEMQADAEIVEVHAELQLVRVALKAVTFTDREVVRDGDVIARVALKRLAHDLPRAGQGNADVGQTL